MSDKNYPSQLPEEVFDAIVIGGGFAGGAISRLLAKRGMKTLVLERGELLQGSSGACAGRVQLIESHPGSYFDLVLRGYRMLPELGNELGVDLEWSRPNHITLFQSAQGLEEYQQQLEAMRQEGLIVEILTPEKIQNLEPYLDISQVEMGVLSEEAHLNPFHFGYGLFDDARQSGAAFLLNSKVLSFTTKSGRITRVDTEKGSFSAGVVIICCGAWTSDLAAMAGGKAEIRFTQAEAVITEPIAPVLNHHIGVEGFFDAVHGEGKGLKLGAGQHPNGTILISNAIHSPEEISWANTDWGLPALAGEFRRYFPDLDRVRIVRSWSAPSPFTPDQLPVLGWDPVIENLFLAAGFYLALPTIPVLAEMAADEIMGEKVWPMLADFKPDRFKGLT